jgi:hypothetical protein
MTDRAVRANRAPVRQVALILLTAAGQQAIPVNVVLR